MSRVLNDPAVEPQFPTEVDFEDLTDEQKAAFVELNSGIHTRTMAKKYLDSTDWYISRKAEADIAIPADVLALRQQARIDASS
jgi:hypothetical protein|tara:strand:- start:13 stop:261 length:249 start_codon:yes stop_codon:yes gene_type:complete